MSRKDMSRTISSSTSFASKDVISGGGMNGTIVSLFLRAASRLTVGANKFVLVVFVVLGLANTKAPMATTVTASPKITPKITRFFFAACLFLSVPPKMLAVLSFCE